MAWSERKFKNYVLFTASSDYKSNEYFRDQRFFHFEVPALKGLILQ